MKFVITKQKDNMAVIVDNPKGFKVIETSMTECFNWGGMAVCDSCNESSNKGYLIAVLNAWYCPECYNEWLNEAVRYEEDVVYENTTFNSFRRILNIETKK
jgi:hypothetical protein